MVTWHSTTFRFYAVGPSPEKTSTDDGNSRKIINAWHGTGATKSGIVQITWVTSPPQMTSYRALQKGFSYIFLCNPRQVEQPRKSLFVGLCTGSANKDCTSLRKSPSCSCLTLRPVPAGDPLSKICKHYLRPLLRDAWLNGLMSTPPPEGSLYRLCNYHTDHYNFPGGTNIHRSWLVTLRCWIG